MNLDSSRRSRSLWLWGALTAGYWLLMVVAFHMPIPRKAGERVVLPPNSDKTIHLVIYCGFGFLLSGTLELYCRRSGRRLSMPAQAALLAAASTLYGFVDERTQPWTGRNYDLGDFAADAVGAAVGIAIYQLLRAIGLFRRLGIEA
jgi:VanZ family protein